MSTQAKQFTEDWHNQPQKRLEHLAKFIGQPVRALEIGCYEGRSTCWLMDNILTHPESHLDAVDPFAYVVHCTDSSEEHREFEAFGKQPLVQVQRRFFDNIEEYGDRIEFHDMPSDDLFMICGIAQNTYDVIVVDGSHSALPTLRDLVHSWQVLKVGGVMVVDDIKWKGDKGFESEGPRKAFEAFLSCVPAEDIRILFRGYIAIVEKVGPA